MRWAKTGGTTMYEYKSEVLDREYGLLKGANKNKEGDSNAFEELINQRAQEGWEPVSHSSLPGSLGGKDSLLILFRKQK